MADFNDLKNRIGEEIGVSGWITVEQSMVDEFARATKDYQPIHNDPAFAASTPFGGTIVHGFLTLSLLTHLITSSDADPAKDVRTVLNYGTDKVRFLAPLPVGSRVRGRFKLLGLVERNPGEYRQTVEATIEIEGASKPALIAEWLFQRFA
nr:MaoC family dehydratase [Sphingomonas sp. CDS-1]